MVFDVWDNVEPKLSPTELEAIQQVCVNGQFSAVDLTRELTARKAKGANAVKAYLDWLMNEVRALLEH